jgi:hypothetical protein
MPKCNNFFRVNLNVDAIDLNEKNLMNGKVLRVVVIHVSYMHISSFGIK